VWSLVGLLLIFFRSQGVRGWQLLAGAVVCVVPVVSILDPLLSRIIPPRFEPYQPVGPDDPDNSNPRTDLQQSGVGKI
jgi:hypothetical protein